MASDGSVTAIGLLLFTAFTQGHFGMLDRSYSINTTVGQRVNLPCLLDTEHSLNILQIDWKKMEGRTEVKIAICNPVYGSPYLYWTNVSVSLEMSGSKLKGSVLELQEVSVWDSGIYVCELTTFPHGTVKAKTSLTVTVLPGNGDPCVYKAVGDSVTFSLQRKDCEEESLSWKLNSRDIFRKIKQSVSVGKPSDVTEDGSLKLVDLQVPSSGEYTAELYGTDGKLCGQARKNLCVIERVSRPNVTYTCSKDAVTLTCNGAESKVNWTINGDTSEGELKKTLTVPGRPAHDTEYSCTAWNEASQEKSEDITVWCEVRLSLTVKPQNEVREGEDVSFLCASAPPADQYTIRTPRKETLKVGADGKFRLQRVTKDDGGTYLCQPQWTPPGPYDAANATVQLRVSSGQALRGGATPRVTSGSEFTLLLATHLLLVLCLSGPVV